MLAGDSLVLYISIIANVESPLQDVLHEALIQEYISLAVQHSRLNWAAIKEIRRRRANPGAADHPVVRMIDVSRPRDAPPLERRVVVRPLAEALEENADRIRSMRSSVSLAPPALSFSICLTLFRFFYIGRYRSLLTDGDGEGDDGAEPVEEED